MLTRIEKDFNIVSEKFPKLILEKSAKGLYHCVGEIDIFDNNNNYWDSFQIKIKLPNGYPYSFPKVFTVGNRIPIEEDRHINKDSSCCVTVLHEEILRASRGITIIQFINEFVVPFFANQLYFEKHKKWANGDYLHRIDGIIQFYKEQTHLKTIDEIILLLKKLPNIRQLGRNDKCFCNSELKYKNCHLLSLNKILSLPVKRVNQDLILIQHYHQQNVK
jgi:ubiquitin-protein ligase